MGPEDAVKFLIYFGLIMTPVTAKIWIKARQRAREM